MAHDTVKPRNTESARTGDQLRSAGDYVKSEIRTVQK